MQVTGVTESPTESWEWEAVNIKRDGLCPCDHMSCMHVQMHSWVSILLHLLNCAAAASHVYTAGQIYTDYFCFLSFPLSNYPSFCVCHTLAHTHRVIQNTQTYTIGSCLEHAVQRKETHLWGGPQVKCPHKLFALLFLLAVSLKFKD